MIGCHSLIRVGFSMPQVSRLLAQAMGVPLQASQRGLCRPMRLRNHAYTVSPLARGALTQVACRGGVTYYQTSKLSQQAQQTACSFALELSKISVNVEQGSGAEQASLLSRVKTLATGLFCPASNAPAVWQGTPV